MTTQVSSTPVSQASKVDNSNFNDWNDLLPKQVTAADTMAVDKVATMWGRLQGEAGLGSADEKKKKGFRLWVYITCALNGSSRSGAYDSIDKLHDGTTVESAIIPRVLGKEIRKFLRGNMIESYSALKSTGAMEAYPRFISRCADLGVGAEQAFATADWMDDCPLFTPLEKEAHNAAFVAGIARARRARGGKTLERVEQEELAKTIRVNGPDAADATDDGSVDF